MFLFILAGRGSELFLKQQSGEKILHIVQKNTDFAAAFSNLGQSLSEEDAMWIGIESFLVELFGTNHEKDTQQLHIEVAEGPAFEQAVQRLSVPASSDAMVMSLGVDTADATVIPDNMREEEYPETDLKDEVSDQAAEEIEPQEEAFSWPEYDGPELPTNASMDYPALGLNYTVTPVIGELSSGFGYRNHPLTAENSFHTGVDIAADIGTPIVAFADGIVEFIGESNAYGLYMQLDHGDGIKTFYCHCSELLYGKGKTVSAGQTIALVGDTGDVTGSHLHLELKKDGILLNPCYYIETGD